MKRIAECDADTLYLTLDGIGINMKELNKAIPLSNTSESSIAFSFICSRSLGRPARATAE
jgi:hypothetical protein